MSRNGDRCGVGEEVHDIEDRGSNAEDSTYHESGAYPFLTMSAFALELPYIDIPFSHDEELGMMS